MALSRAAQRAGPGGAAAPAGRGAGSLAAGSAGSLAVDLGGECRIELTPPVLVVEHDPEIGRAMVAQLLADGYRAQLALTAEHARALARADPPLLALLGDLGDPRAALALLGEIRGRDLDAPASKVDRWPASTVDPWPASTVDPWRAGLPVIVVSARADEFDLLRAFEAGADDFFARPSGYLELRARLRAVLVRAGAPHAARCMEVGPLEIDAEAHAVYLHGAPVKLRRMEFELLVYLAGEPRRVFTKQELMRTVWRYAAQGTTRTLDSHASRLRRKLRARGRERWIINVRGVGYRLI
jgi:DNA-binding response OmpR family regulator